MSGVFRPPIDVRFAVVIDPGTLFQRVESYHESLVTAQAEESELRQDGESVSVMRVKHATLDEPARLSAELWP